MSLTTLTRVNQFGADTTNGVYPCDNIPSGVETLMDGDFLNALKGVKVDETIYGVVNDSSILSTIIEDYGINLWYEFKQKVKKNADTPLAFPNIFHNPEEVKG